MEYFLDELKQYDLEPISASNLECGNYYIEYDENYTIKYFYYYANDFIKTLNASYYKINYPNFNYGIIVDILINYYSNVDETNIKIFIDTCANIDTLIVIFYDDCYYQPYCDIKYIFNKNTNNTDSHEIKLHEQKKILITFQNNSIDV